MTTQLAVTSRESKAVKQIQKHGVAKYLSIQANVERTESVTQFANYIDEKGNASTNPARYNAGINAKIKKLFGLSVDEMKDESMLDAVAQINLDIARAHKIGIKNKLLRREIRNHAHRLCELGFDAYELKMKLLRG